MTEEFYRCWSGVEQSWLISSNKVHRKHEVIQRFLVDLLPPSPASVPLTIQGANENNNLHTRALCQYKLAKAFQREQCSRGGQHGVEMIGKLTLDCPRGRVDG